MAAIHFWRHPRTKYPETSGIRCFGRNSFSLFVALPPFIYICLTHDPSRFDISTRSCTKSAINCHRLHSPRRRPETHCINSKRRYEIRQVKLDISIPYFGCCPAESQRSSHSLYQRGADHRGNDQKDYAGRRRSQSSV